MFENNISKRVKIGLPDGNGCFGSLEFWKDYFTLIGVDYIENEDDKYNLERYVKKSNEIFPPTICVNSKYRLGRAIEMAEKVDYFMFFLRNDTISNCMASIYRMDWIKTQFPDIKCIVWKRDLLPNESDNKNLMYLSQILTGNTNGDKLKNMMIPKRKVIYDMSLRKIDRTKKTFMLIGVAPFFIDLYRRSALMDHIVTKVNLLNPTSVATPNIVEEKSKLYKENTIIDSINKVEKHDLVDGYILTGDAFDFPGKYSFFKLKNYINKHSRKQVLELIPGIHNEQQCKQQFDKFLSGIEVET